MEVLASRRFGNFGLELKRGQFVIGPSGAPDDASALLRIGVVIAGELWLAELRPGTILGVRVDPREPTKFEQVFDKNAYRGAFYVGAGEGAVITDPAGEAHEIKGLATLELPLHAGSDGKAAKSQRLEKLPKWFGPPSLNSRDQNYARLFERKFTFGEAVELSIPEVASDPIPRVSQLATECLGLIGAYGTLIDILDRSLHEEARKAAISELRLWLPRSPENKELLKAELAKRFSADDAAMIYELLWGYDEGDAQSRDQSVKLIDWMDSPVLAIRELAFYQVFGLTKKDFDYRAGYKPERNRNPLRRWQEHVKKDGGLLPAQKPVANPESRASSIPSSEPPSTEPKGTASNRQIAVTVNGQPVFVDDILRQLPPEVTESLTKAEGESSPEEYPEVRQHILKPYIEVQIDRELLLQSLKSKIKEDQLKGIEKQIGATFHAEGPASCHATGEAATIEAEFERTLRKRGSSIDLLQSQFRNPGTRHSSTWDPKRFAENWFRSA